MEPPPINPPGNANMMFPSGLAVLDSIRPSQPLGGSRLRVFFPNFIRPAYSPGEAGCGWGREPPMSSPLEGGNGRFGGVRLGA